MCGEEWEEEEDETFPRPAPKPPEPSGPCAWAARSPFMRLLGPPLPLSPPLGLPVFDVEDEESEELVPNMRARASAYARSLSETLLVVFAVEDVLSLDDDDVPLPSFDDRRLISFMTGAFAVAAEEASLLAQRSIKRTRGTELCDVLKRIMALRYINRRRMGDNINERAIKSI